MVTSVVKEIFMTAKGESFESFADAVHQELVDQMISAIEVTMEGYADYNFYHVCHELAARFYITPKPTTEESPDGQT